MNIHVTPATPAEKPILRNLGELYAYDFSAITQTELGPLGRYDHDFFSRCDGGAGLLAGGHRQLHRRTLR